MEHEQGLPHLRAACQKARDRNVASTNIGFGGVICSHIGASMEDVKAQAEKCPKCSHLNKLMLDDDHPYKKPPLTQDQARKAAERAEHLTEEEIDRIFASVRNPMREKWMNDIDPGWTSGTVATAVVIGALAVCALVFFGWLVVG